jgi:hypothetical protein
MEEKAHAIDPCFVTSANEVLPQQIYMYKPCQQSKGSKLWRIWMRHVAITRIHGPTREANRLKILHTPRMYPRAHMECAGRKLEASRAYKGSVELPQGRFILALHVVISHWSRALFPGCFLRSSVNHLAYK